MLQVARLAPKLLGESAELVRGLEELQKQTVFVPHTVDQAVLRAARRHLAKPAKRTFRWLVWIPSVGIAALILILGVWWTLTSNRPPISPIAREDINHDGRVDILDAFALAHELQGKARLTSKMDLNGDGVVDERDVELIARNAVKLGKRGPS